MSIHVVSVKALLVFLFFVAINGQNALSNILLATGRARSEAKVTEEEQSDLFVSSGGDKSASMSNEARRGIEQETEENPEVKKFRQDLRKKLNVLESEFDAAEVQVKKRHEQERQEMSKPNEEAVERAAAILDHTREALNDLEDQRPTFFPYRTTRLVAVRIYDWPAFDPTSTIAMITPANAAGELARAQSNYRAALRSRQAPKELRGRHRNELQECRAVKKRVLTEIRRVYIEALKAVRAAAGQQDLLEAEKAKWTEKVRELIEDAQQALAKVRASYRRVCRAEPIGFFTPNLPSGSKSRTDAKANFAVVARVHPGYFIPSPEEYTILQDEHSRVKRGSEGKELLRREIIYEKVYHSVRLPTWIVTNRSRRPIKGSTVYYRRFQLRVFNSSLFKLVCEDGRVFNAIQFIEPDDWGGEVIVNSRPKSSGPIANHLCIIRYGKYLGAPPILEIKIGWLLPEDCAGPYKLQFANFEPAPVPEN